MGLLDLTENKRLIQQKEKRSLKIDVGVNYFKIGKINSTIESHFDCLKIEVIHKWYKILMDGVG